MKNYSVGAIFISFVGAIYSFFLVFTTFTRDVCLVSGGCPHLFGLPICLFGFVGFVCILVLSVLVYQSPRSAMGLRALRLLYWLSLGGALFALYYLIQELFILECPQGACKISLWYPSCLYGLIAFVLVFVAARSMENSIDNPNNQKKV